MRLGRKRHATTFTGVVLAMLFAACGGSDVEPATGDEAVATVEQSPSESQQSSSTPPEEPPALPSEEVVRQYFDALSEYDPAALRRALRLTEEGSTAHAYGGYILALVNAAIDGGLPYEGAPVTKVAGGYESCDVSDPSSCVTWTNVKGRDGKIVAFKVSNRDVSQRITAGNGSTVAAGDLASVEFLYAYKSVQSDNLVVPVAVRSGATPVKIAAYQATYRDASGRQITASGTDGPDELAANSRATVAMTFPGARPGGVVSLPFFSDDFMVEAQAQFRTR